MTRPIRLTIDFESYYDSEVSLRKMTPVEYLCHPKFHVIGAALRFDDTAPLPAPVWEAATPNKGKLRANDSPNQRGPRAFGKKAKWYSARELPRVFAEIGARVGWENIMLVSHNIGFDGCLLAWRYGILPGLYLDTLGMARASVIADSARASLDALAGYFGLPPKGSEIKHASGWTLDMFERPENRAFYLAYQRYCEHDADCAAALFACMAWQFTGKGGKASPSEHAGEEFAVMDMVARMTIMPQFGLDTQVLQDNLTRILDNKANLLDALVEEGLITLDAKGSPPELMSGDKLADLLRALGVEPPMKWSIKKKRMDWAFSKTDKEFQELLQHDDEMVQMVVAARLGVKSTQEETRTQRFLDIANVTWPVESDDVFPPPLMDNPCLPAAPFPLKYSGAHTHRLSGDWGLNLQNLGRKSELRRAIVAPPGYEVVSADASQIEARIVAWLAGAHRVVDAFARGEDVYSTLASDVYGFAVNKTDHPMERFVGKVGVLGLGFGMGPPKFQLTVWNQSERKTTIDLVLSKSTVSAYRTKLAPEVPRYWKLMEVVQGKLAARERYDFGCMFTDYDQSIVLPNGMRLYYLDMGLREVDDLFNPGQKKMSWTFRYGRETKYTFGGKMTENCLAGDTLVLTEFGWKRLDNITTERVWDGEEWVAHSGLIDQGEQKTLFVDGVEMTSDHEVLTEKGWVHGADCEGLDRQRVALPDGASALWGGLARAQNLGGALRVRRGEGNARFGVPARENEVVRLQAGIVDFLCEYVAWDDQPSSVLGVALDGGPLLASVSPSVAQLRRARDHSLPALAEVRKVLGGYGTDIYARSDAGPREQQPGIPPRQLSLGWLQRAGEEQAGEHNNRLSVGASHSSRGVGAQRYRQDDSTLSNQERRTRVFDLLNAGPRHRFVIAGETGPLIVHNCVQSLARIITMGAAARIRKESKKMGITRILAGQIHDQLIYLAPTREAETLRDMLVHEMSQRRDWYATLPLAAEGAIGPNLLEAK